MQKAISLYPMNEQAQYAIAPNGELLAVSREFLDQIAAGSGPNFTVDPQEKPNQSKIQGVAVVPIFGFIAQRPNLQMRIFGGVSTESLSRNHDALIADTSVRCIVYNFHSPGGGVFGVAEFAEKLFNSRSKKTVIAQINSMAGSGAYWIAAGASEVVITPAGELGGIGIYSLHSEFSARDAREGVKHTIISAGKFKTAGNSHEPLGTQSRGYLQKNVDRYHEMFVSAVARYRNRPIAEVRNGFGEGGMVGAEAAVRLHMADSIYSLDETIARMLRSGGSKSAKSYRSQADQRLTFPTARHATSTMNSCAPGCAWLKAVKLVEHQDQSVRDHDAKNGREKT